MLSEAFALLAGSFVLMLRLGDSAGSFPRPLTEKEETQCVTAWITEADIEARNKLIEHNLRLVAHIAKKYYAAGADQDDLISIGTIGLIKGVSTYRPDKGVRLATYASRCIENEMLMHFRASKKSAGDLSLSESIESDGESGGLSLMDVISHEDDTLERISTAETNAGLMHFLDERLTKRESNIIRMRYGLCGSKRLTQRETAEKCGISRSYISRIEKRAIEKLREAFNEWNK